MARTHDFPPAVVEELTACLRVIFRQGDNPFCIVDWGSLYVQYLGREEYGNLWFEAVSDHFLAPHGVSLTPAQKASLGTMDFLPLGTVANNYCSFLPIEDEADFTAAALFGLSVLWDAYGWRGERLDIRCPLRDHQLEEAEEPAPKDETLEEEKPRRHTAQLPCGQVLGDIGGIGPFLFVAVDRPDRFFSQRRVDLGRPGIYVLEKVENEYHRDLAGFILPLSGCRDDALRQGLLAASRILADADAHDVAAYRDRAIAMLNATGLPVTAKDGSGRGGGLELDGLPLALPRLGGVMEQASSIFDDPNGSASITATETFAWTDYPSLLQWIYKGDTSDAWGHASLFLVAGGVRTLREWWKEFFCCQNITTPELRLGEFFQLRADLAEPEFSVTFEQRDYGWAYLHLVLGGQRLSIDLSNVYPPFDTMLEWLKRIDAGEPSAAFAIDEEGTEKRLAVLPTDDPRRLLFLVQEVYEETIHLQGVVNRARLVAAFKTEFLRFFRDEFSASRWDGDEPEIGERIRQAILGDPWLADA